MIPHDSLSKARLHSLIRSKTITCAGNANLKIYGRFDCHSGRRMSSKNRVFFESSAEAIEQGFRPCGNCLVNEYKVWKSKRAMS